MQDGRTRKASLAPERTAPHGFLLHHRPLLVVVEGDEAGEEYPLERTRVIVGRGESCDWRFDDDAMSKEHAAFELAEDGFRVRDLASTNGVAVNGRAELARDLLHGDRLQIGEHVLQYVVQERASTPTYDLSEDG